MLTQINPVLGDFSAVACGLIPHQLDDNLRIQTHLRFVCRYLELADTDHLSTTQLQNRRHLIKALSDYADAGIFPQRQTDSFRIRRPRFIDHRGVHCAVGHLIEFTDGHALPEQINQRHEFDYIADFDMDEVAQWADVNGLSQLECAMIQPQYLDPSQFCPYLAIAPGSELEQRADAVRRFRDQRLNNNLLGKKFVQTYYKIGPGMVRFMDDHPWTQGPVRRTLLLVTKHLK